MWHSAQLLLPAFYDNVGYIHILRRQREKRIGQKEVKLRNQIDSDMLLLAVGSCQKNLIMCLHIINGALVLCNSTKRNDFCFLRLVYLCVGFFQSLTEYGLYSMANPKLVD